MTPIAEGSDFAPFMRTRDLTETPTCIHEDENPDKPCYEVRCDDCPFSSTYTVKLRSKIVYLDMDGVLADFDKRAQEVLGMDPHKFAYVYGDDVFWHRLNKFPNFFEELEAMPDAAHLYYAVEHLNPVILTALPRSNPDRVDAQKRQWAYEQFGPKVKVITCFTKDKPNYCNPGDILIDDRAINQAAWRRKGGHFIIHTSAENSINQLINLGAL